MVWIQASTEHTVTAKTTLAAAFEMVKDVQVIASHYPGVDRVEDQGDGKYRWLLAPRTTLGTTFVGDYVNQYRDNGKDEVTFETLHGNMKVKGRWRVTGVDGAARITESLTTELDAPVPRVLKKPATLFAEREVKQGVTAQLEGIKRALERA